MTASLSKLSYQDCYVLLDKCLEDPTGTRVRRKSRDDAQHLRSRLNYARFLDRKENLQVYVDGDPLYGRSVYDPIMFSVRLERGHWYVYLLRLESIEYPSESLSNVEHQRDDSDTRAPRGEEETEVKIRRRI